MPYELARGFHLHGHVRQAEIDRLMLGDRLAERDALPCVRERVIERRARHADRLRGDADAPGFEIGERDAIAAAFLAEPVARGNHAVLEHDLRGVGRMLPELFLDARDRVPRRARLDDECRDALLARGLVRDREHDGDVRVLAAS